MFDKKNGLIKEKIVESLTLFEVTSQHKSDPQC